MPRPVRQPGKEVLEIQSGASVLKVEKIPEVISLIACQLRTTSFHSRLIARMANMT